MAPIVSRAAACAQLLRHLTETLRTWPSGTVLALRHPDLPKAVLHDGVTMGLAADFDEDGPEGASAVFTIRYWVIGATPENSDRYFDLLVAAWQAAGRPVQVEQAHPRAGCTKTADGYRFSVGLSLNGYLSLAGSTPPFWSHGPDGPDGSGGTGASSLLPPRIGL
ncbi:hypothetical protein ACF9IK_01990 [Kitasatospora hibisci]|uniref:hypothetical protein n=1 Tax=Kitasatospora hibisci TaxID=3369522 RepID=UPI003754BA54